MDIFGCKCFHWSRVADFSYSEPETFSLPSPIPQWPPGQGFATGRINLGELEIISISRFEFIWGYFPFQNKKDGVSFYKPVGIPDGFHCLGHYCQFNDRPFNGFVLVAREVAFPESVSSNPSSMPALQKPLDYVLVWSPDDGRDENQDDCGYFWLPQPPDGYKAMGYVVTNKPGKPEVDEVRCVRDDLTDKCETDRVILKTNSKFPKFQFHVWSTRPCHQGMMGKGVLVGTFFCSSYWSFGEEMEVACLKNTNSMLHAMPNLDQIHALIKHYGPTVFFHPDELYLPSSVSWFFQNGALLYKKGCSVGEPIDTLGSNLPSGGTNDGEYWIDLPRNDQSSSIKYGNLESAVLHVHVKPALGGTFTDIAMWVFCPFNGPATVKIGIMSFPLSKVGQHVGDWEHFTLRISNFTGELCSIYFSQHSGGKWADACELEFVEGNKAVVYSTKSGHASFPHPGTYLQGSSRLGIGIRNDAARSNFYVDSCNKYEIVAAEYLNEGVVKEPCWLQYMREWGPTIVYNSKTEVDRIISFLPVMLRYSLGNFFAKLPLELYGEEGPTGPKEKNNWVGDERE
ncbi:Vacuolar protein sorting-associated protein 62 [Dillenia turbinata]|uniref:Vacuolar protein sorting-associated protein 62 n=1 Tax=Dillenia turbinata TaxID=194707 RepID=A0AAN8ZH08_9MAGN